MKRISLITLISILTFFSVGAQSLAEEYREVSKVLNAYLVGGTNNDFETLKKAFHPNATMKYVDGDAYREVNALEFFKKGMEPGPPQNRQTFIEFIEIIGNMAQARLKIDYGTFCFHDFMQLLKVDGEWKIISKIFYKQNK